MRRFVPMSPRAATMAAVFALLGANAAHAVDFSLAAQSGDTWTYTLTYDPLDNYAIPGVEDQATIRLSGLSGVVSATGPSSTDYEDPFGNQVNLRWTAEVLNGGTEVVWTHVGPGTGNYEVPLHVFGFSVFAPGQASGAAVFQTTGFSTDRDRGLIDRDVVGSVMAPVPEPATWALGLAGLLMTGAAARARRRV